MKIRVLRTIIGTISAAALLAGAGGCGTKGQHTQKFKAEAAERMSQMKAATQFDMAHQQFLAGDLDKALRSVDGSIALNDTVSRSHVLRARILIEQGRLEPALESLARATELDPESADPHYYTGIVHERFTQFEPAMISYDRAAALDTTNPQYALAAAEMLIDQGELRAARARLERDKKNFEHNAGVRQTLGHISVLEGDYRRAVTDFQEAALLAPDDLSLMEDMARAQAMAGDFSGAEANLRRILAHEPGRERTDLLRLRATCLAEMNKPVEARELLLALVGSDAGRADAGAWVQLGDVALTLNDWPRVREAGRQAVAVAPQMAGHQSGTFS